MSVIYASGFEDIKMAPSARHSQHVDADLPRAAVPSHIPQPLQLKKKKNHLHLPSPSSLPPSIPPSAQFRICNALVIPPPLYDVLVGGSVHLIKMDIFKSGSCLA